MRETFKYRQYLTMEDLSADDVYLSHQSARLQVLTVRCFTLMGYCYLHCLLDRKTYRKCEVGAHHKSGISIQVGPFAK